MANDARAGVQARTAAQAASQGSLPAGGYPPAVEAVETVTTQVRDEHEADVWLDQIAARRGLVGASLAQLAGGRLQVTAKVPRRIGVVVPGRSSIGDVTPASPEQGQGEQLELGWWPPGT